MGKPALNVCRLAGRLLAGIALLIGASRELPAADPPEKGRLLFLGVTYDEGPPRGFDAGHFDYAADNFSQLLKQQSRELYRNVDASALQGAEATHDHVLRELRQLQRRAKPDDVVFLYWGTHGATGRDGWCASLPGGGTIYGSEIKQLLGELPCHVVCVISTCGSGGFQGGQADGTPLPENVTAFCACRRRQSTTNELDRALCEALAGFADADDSGDVTIREALDYVPKRYRKLFPDVAADDPARLPVLAWSDTAALDRPLTKVDGTYAAAVSDGAWYGVTVLETRRNGTKVRFLGYDATTPNAGFSMPDAVVADEMLDLPGGEPPIEVEWEGAWYPARILERSRSGLRIHYIGYPESDDETVPRSRVRFPFADRPGENP